MLNSLLLVATPSSINSNNALISSLLPTQPSASISPPNANAPLPRIPRVPKSILKSKPSDLPSMASTPVSPFPDAPLPTTHPLASASQTSSSVASAIHPSTGSLTPLSAISPTIVSPMVLTTPATVPPPFHTRFPSPNPRSSASQVSPPIAPAIHPFTGSHLPTALPPKSATPMELSPSASTTVSPSPDALSPLTHSLVPFQASSSVASAIHPSAGSPPRPSDVAINPSSPSDSSDILKLYTLDQICHAMAYTRTKLSSPSHLLDSLRTILDNVRYPISVETVDQVDPHGKLLVPNYEQSISVFNTHVDPTTGTHTDFTSDLQLEPSALTYTHISLETPDRKIHHIQGIVDGGSQLPVLSTQLCLELNIPTQPIPSGHWVTTYFDNRIHLALRKTPPLIVRYSTNKIVRAVFLVLDSPTSKCLIGGKLLEHLGIFDIRHVSKTPPPDTIPHTLLINALLVTPTKPKLHILKTPTYIPSPEEMTLEHWDTLPASTPHDLPLQFSGSAPTRTHVVDHPLAPDEAILVERLLPPIFRLLNHNNAVTAGRNFIDHSLAVVHLSHDEGTTPKFIPQPKSTNTRKRDAVRQQISIWLKNLKIETVPSGTSRPWNSPLLTAPKPNSFDDKGDPKLRVCFDGSRSVNIGLKTGPCTTPGIQDVLNRCSGASFFSELDCEDAYLQLLLDAESRNIAAFEFEGQAYHFIGAPYGITHIGNIFQTCMETIFKDMPNVLIYIDNIWIISDNDPKLHQTHLMEVIQRCTDFHIRINLKKPILFKREFVGLGHKISKDGLSLDPTKVESVLSWQPESIKTAAQLTSFLGITNYLRSSIRHYADLTTPLYIAAKQSPKTLINWSPDLRSSFSVLQHAIATAPLLHYVDRTKPFAIATDASRLGIGSVLFQPKVEGELPNADNIVTFHSRCLHRYEKGYSTYKLEFLSIIVALRTHFNHIWGTRFTLYTDHESLTNILTQPTFNNTYAGWIIELADFAFNIVHIPGTQNVLPDTLSRMYVDKWGLPPLPSHIPLYSTPHPTPSTDVRPTQVLSLSVSNPVVSTSESLFHSQLHKVHTPYHPKHASINMLTSGMHPTGNVPDNTPSVSSSEPTLSPQHDSLDSPSEEDLTTHALSPDSSSPPTDAQLQLLHLYHNKGGHWGISATYHRLRRQGHNWPNMFRHLQTYTASCHICQQWTIVKRGHHPIRSPQAWWPFDIVQYDLAVSFPKSSSGNTVLLVVIDVLSGFVLLRPLKDKTSTTIARALILIFSDFGTPRILHSDNESCLVSDVLRNIYSYLGIHTQTSVPYTSHSLGKAERAIGVACNCIRKYLAETGTEWDNLAPQAQLYMNNKIKDLTGSDPFALMFNRSCNIFELQDPNPDSSFVVRSRPLSELSFEEWKAHQANLQHILFPAIRQRVAAKNAKLNSHFNSTHTQLSRRIPIGTLVAIRDVDRTSKNEPTMLSPFTIHSYASDGSYLVKDSLGTILKRSVPAHDIRPLYQARPPDCEEDYYLDYIKDHKIVNGRDKYYVKWSGYSDDFNSWVDVTGIRNPTSILEFQARHSKIPRTHKSKRTYGSPDSDSLPSTVLSSQSSSVVPSFVAPQSTTDVVPVSSLHSHVDNSQLSTSLKPTLNAVVHPTTVVTPTLYTVVPPTAVTLSRPNLTTDFVSKPTSVTHSIQDVVHTNSNSHSNSFANSKNNFGKTTPPLFLPIHPPHNTARDIHTHTLSHSGAKSIPSVVSDSAPISSPTKLPPTPVSDMVSKSLSKSIAPVIDTDSKEACSNPVTSAYEREVILPVLHKPPHKTTPMTLSQPSLSSLLENSHSLTPQGNSHSLPQTLTPPQTIRSTSPSLASPLIPTKPIISTNNKIVPPTISQPRLPKSKSILITDNISNNTQSPVQSQNTRTSTRTKKLPTKYSKYAYH